MKLTSALIIAGVLFLLADGSAKADATNRYVATNGPGPFPYTNWATAASNIQDAVNVANFYNAGDMVIISNGIYYLTNQVTVSNTVVTNFSGDRTQVVVNGNFNTYTNRCFYLKHANARLVGLTITNGAVTNGNGGGIYLSSGCVSNCVIAGNRAWMADAAAHGGGGGGIYMSGGVVSHCDIVGNTVYVDTSGRQGGGGGVAMNAGGTLSYSRLAFNMVATNVVGVGGGVSIYSAGIVDHCEIVSNSCSPDRYGLLGGGGVYLSGSGCYVSNCIIMGNSTGAGENSGSGVCINYSGIIRNCLIAYNSTGTDRGAVGLSANPSVGRVENCTIVSNYNGGLFMRDNNGAAISNVVNCIIYWNQGSAIGGDLECKTAMVYSCVSPGYDTWKNPGGTTNDPLLVSIESRNFRLSANSPCVNTGMNQNWMTGAVDLDGRRRIDRFNGRVDMGAYELINAGTLFNCR